MQMQKQTLFLAIARMYSSKMGYMYVYMYMFWHGIDYNTHKHNLVVEILIRNEMVYLDVQKNENIHTQNGVMYK